MDNHRQYGVVIVPQAREKIPRCSPDGYCEP